MTIPALAWQHLKEMHLLYGFGDCWARCSQVGLSAGDGSTVIALRDESGVFRTFPGLTR